MKNFNYLITILILFVLSIGNVLAQRAKYDPSKLYSAEELKEDLAFTKENLERYHPGIYWYISKSELDDFYDSIYQSIEHPLTEFEFYASVYPIFQKISEGHNKVFLSEKGYKWLKEEVRTIPFSIRCLDNRLFINKNGSDNLSLQRGTEIKSINGYTASEIISQMEKRAISDGKNTSSILRYSIEKHFWRYFNLFFSVSENFQLKIQQVGSLEVKEVSVPGVTRNEFEKITNERYEVQESFYRNFIIVNDNKTAIFKLGSFLNNKEDNELGISSNLEYFQYVFETLNDNPSVKNLIIDIRENGGGHPGAEISMLSYFSDKSHKVYKRVERNTWALFFQKDSLGKYSSDKVLGYSNEPKENRFEGQVFVLVNGKTYSAATSFAVSLDQFTDAVIVGEETGGGFYGTTAGSWKRLKTPNVKLDLAIPKVRYLMNVSGQPEGRGLLPDYEITQTVEDFWMNTDTELNFTLELIRRRESQVLNK